MSCSSRKTRTRRFEVEDLAGKDEDEMRNIAAVLHLLVVMLLKGANCIHAAEPVKKSKNH